MQTAERLTVATPEDIEITLTLAGVGARFSAAFLDLLVQVGIILVVLNIIGVVLGPASTIGGNVVGAVFIAVVLIVVFTVFFFYHLVFELFWRGRTLGKAAFRIYVVMDGGQPLTPAAATIRNLLRIVDFLPIFYMVGLISVVLSKKRKRLGDHVAATIVLRKPRPEPGTGSVPIAPRPPALYEQWDIVGLSEEDELLVRRFLLRRRYMRFARRQDLATKLANYVRPKIIGNIAQQPAEFFLESVTLRTAQRSSPQAQPFVPVWVWSQVGPAWSPGHAQPWPGQPPPPGPGGPANMGPPPPPAPPPRPN